MERKARHRILQFLLARFKLLNLLVDEARKCNGGLHPINHRLLWVFLQANPSGMLSEDAFQVLSEAFRTASIEDLKQQIRAEHAKLEPILEFVNDPATNQPRRRPLYCFLDEIQVATIDRMGEFRSDDKKMKRPLLRPIWSTLTDFPDMLLIISGTGIDWKSLQDVLGSSVFKLNPYNVKRDIGAFDDPSTQRQYIERYLSVERSTARDTFLERAWGWCRGRYFSHFNC
jgi:hypothetical protein